MRIIRTLLISLIILLNANIAFAASEEKDYSKITNNGKLVQTLNYLSETSQKPQKDIYDVIMGNNRSGKPIKLMFQNLSLMNYDYRNYEALTCLDKSGKIYILINERHKDAPIEAIISLLSHEVVHQDDVSSIKEEVQGWLNEAKTWITMKDINPELNNKDLEKYPLVKRLNQLENLYKSANYTTEKLEQAIAVNYGYRNLAMYSPGYNE